jgi:adenylyl- and sulfurtransferase ThiI
MKGLSKAIDMASKMPTLLVRYGEVGLKSERVRRRFEAALEADIRLRHIEAGLQCIVSRERGRIFVESDDWRRTCELLSKTFGVVSFSAATKVGSDLEGLVANIVDFAEPLLFAGATFAIRARRTGSHRYSSLDVCRKAGEAVLSANASRGVSVDLDDPDVELSVEVRGRDAYLFSSTLPGPGGMPRSTQGRVLSSVSSTAGTAASWLLMKRGCTVITACEDDSLVEHLEKWDPELRVVRKEKDLFAQASREKCSAISLDCRIRDLDEMELPTGPLPVFHPLIGLTDDEMAVLQDRISRG